MSEYQNDLICGIIIRLTGGFYYVDTGESVMECKHEVNSAAMESHL